MAKKKTSRKVRVKAKSKRLKADYLLRLYITGNTPQSLRAIVNIKRICEEYLTNRYNLEVIDIYKKPELARGEQIIAAPTLVKSLPHPLRKLIGDLSNTEKVLLGLDLQVSRKSTAKLSPGA